MLHTFIKWPTYVKSKNKLEAKAVQREQFNVEIDQVLRLYKGILL